MPYALTMSTVLSTTSKCDMTAWRLRWHTMPSYCSTRRAFTAAAHWSTLATTAASASACPTHATSSRARAKASMPSWTALAQRRFCRSESGVSAALAAAVAAAVAAVMASSSRCHAHARPWCRTRPSKAMPSLRHAAPWELSASPHIRRLMCSTTRSSKNAAQFRALVQRSIIAR